MTTHTASTDISTASIIRIIGVILAILALFVLRDVVVILFVSLVLAAALDPTVSALERRGVPRFFGVLALFALLTGVIAIILVTFVPLVVREIADFSSTFPQLWNRAFPYLAHLTGGQSLTSGFSIEKVLSGVTTGLFHGLASAFNGLVTVLATAVLTFYFVVEERGVRRLAVSLTPNQYRPYVAQLISRIEERLGRWLRGQLTLGLIIAVLSYIGLTLLKIKFALVLALIAGLGELLPSVGPYIAMVPAAIVAGAQAPMSALWVVLVYYGIQQLENNLIVPRVMAKATGLNPMIVLIAILTGATLAGLVGIILAIPTVIIITSFTEDFLQEEAADAPA